jgi:catechol 2,3-dioxygenase-like lactoylglutathione lyase family enzyme
VSFIAGLDHVVVLVHDLDAAVAAYQVLFGRAPASRSSSRWTI